jgi:hypothetical protein
MNRLNQTEPATFSILSCWAFFKDSYFSLFCYGNKVAYPDFLSTSTSKTFVVWPQGHEWLTMRGTWNRIPIAVIAIDGISYEINSPMNETQNSFIRDIEYKIYTK